MRGGVGGVGFYAAFNNFSVKSRRTVISAGGKSALSMWRRDAANPAGDSW